MLLRKPRFPFTSSSLLLSASGGLMCRLARSSIFFLRWTFSFLTFSSSASALEPELLDLKPNLATMVSLALLDVMAASVVTKCSALGRKVKWLCWCWIHQKVCSLIWIKEFRASTPSEEELKTHPQLRTQRNEKQKQKWNRLLIIHFTKASWVNIDTPVVLSMNIFFQFHLLKYWNRFNSSHLPCIVPRKENPFMLIKHKKNKIKTWQLITLSILVRMSMVASKHKLT